MRNGPESEPEQTLLLMDEILQVMYWLHGEGFGREVSSRGLTRWMAAEPEQIGSVLTRMAVSGLVESLDGPDGKERFRLTADGIREGGRRFADEFAELTRPWHGECGDPDCECRRTGEPADCRHQTL